MEAKCDGCKEYFSTDKLKVCQSGGVYCWGEDPNCRPPYAKPVVITCEFNWAEITSLVDYLSGDTSLDVLMQIDDLKSRLELAVYERLKRVLKRDGGTNGDGEVQQSDS